MSKFFSKKVTVDGMVFDSKKEYNRFLELKNLQLEEFITGLQRQVRFEILPRFKGTIRNKSERAVYYTCDFLFVEDGTLVIEDVKSDFTKRDRDYILRRKMFKNYYLIDEKLTKLHDLFPNMEFEYAVFNEVVL